MYNLSYHVCSHHSLLFPASSPHLPPNSEFSILLAINDYPLTSSPCSWHRLCLYMPRFWTPSATYFNKYFTPEVNGKHVTFLRTGLWNVSGNTLYASWQLILDLKIVYFPSNVRLLSLCIALIQTAIQGENDCKRKTFPLNAETKKQNKELRAVLCFWCPKSCFLLRSTILCL